MEHLVIGKRNAISNWFRQFATHVNLQARTYKIQESLIGIFNWGRYEQLPVIDYVLVFRQVFAKCEACAIEDYEQYDYAYFQVSLVHHKTRRIIVHETRNKEEAFEMADTLASRLNIKLKDSASDRKKAGGSGSNRLKTTTALIIKMRK
jgi:hypothetical protein